MVTEDLMLRTLRPQLSFERSHVHARAVRGARRDQRLRRKRMDRRELVDESLTGGDVKNGNLSGPG